MQSTSTLPVASIRAVVQSPLFVEASSPAARRVYFVRATATTREATEKTGELTAGQRDNRLWRQVRRGRLTASEFGRALTGGHASNSLVDRLAKEACSAADGVDDASEERETIEAIAWGTANETKAVAWFEATTGLRARGTGIWLHPEAGFLGASPDGLVDPGDDREHGDDRERIVVKAKRAKPPAVLEVKCPFSARNYGTVKEAAEALPRFCLEFAATSDGEHDGDDDDDDDDDDGGGSPSLRLKPTHRYWQQVQAQMHFTGRPLCYFVVWLPRDGVVVEVERDKRWLERDLPRLTGFYLSKVIPRVVHHLRDRDPSPASPETGAVVKNKNDCARRRSNEERPPLSPPKNQNAR